MWPAHAAGAGSSTPRPGSPSLALTTNATPGESRPADTPQAEWAAVASATAGLATPPADPESPELVGMVARHGACARVFGVLLALVRCHDSKTPVLALALRHGGKYVELLVKTLPFWRPLLRAGHHHAAFQVLVRHEGLRRAAAGLVWDPQEKGGSGRGAAIPEGPAPLPAAAPCSTSQNPSGVLRWPTAPPHPLQVKNVQKGTRVLQVLAAESKVRRQLSLSGKV